VAQTRAPCRDHVVSFHRRPAQHCVAIGAFYVLLRSQAGGCGMTPFGAKVVKLRGGSQRITPMQMAAYLELSEAYLSTLEHGPSGPPSEAGSSCQICEYFHLILWDMTTRRCTAFAAISHPKVYRRPPA